MIELLPNKFISIRAFAKDNNAYFWSARGKTRNQNAEVVNQQRVSKCDVITEDQIRRNRAVLSRLVNYISFTFKGILKALQMNQTREQGRSRHLKIFDKTLTRSEMDWKDSPGMENGQWRRESYLLLVSGEKCKQTIASARVGATFPNLFLPSNRFA